MIFYECMAHYFSGVDTKLILSNLFGNLGQYVW